ncbi:MAG: winged helix-turn-helix transcriptional regulator [Lachnospiraceae bacterium]|nr:winged helix-turn-helix transcriptional regulator [Lachnospiraceae bacterium]
MDRAESKSSIWHFKLGRHIILTLFFFIYNYTYSTVNSSFYSYTGKFFTEKYSILFNKLMLLVFAASLIVFGLLFSVIDIKSMNLSRLMGGFTLITSLLMLFFFKSNSKYVFLISAYVLIFIIGIECVYYYKLMYRAFSYMSHTGCVYIISMSSAIIMQYYFQSYAHNYNYALYSLLLLTFIAAFMNLSGAADYLSDTEPEEVINSKPFNDSNFKYTYIGMVVVIILFELIGNFLSYPLLVLMYNGNALVYDSPRLFIVFSYIIMGLVADIKDMKYIPAITSAIVIFDILNPVLMREDSSIYTNTCIYYIVAGVINSFFVLMMFKLARGHRFAPFIAVSGRIIDSIFSFIFTSSFISDFSLINIIGIELVAIIIIMMVFAFMGMFDFGQNRRSASRHISPSDFSKRYGMTEKETEVFTAALSFDGTMSELAKSLYMSRSVLYRNLGNICDKTGCNSFQAVKHLYYELPAEEAEDSEEVIIAESKKHSRTEKTTTDISNTEKKDNDKYREAEDLKSNNAKPKSLKLKESDEIAATADERTVTSEEEPAEAVTEAVSFADKIKQFKEYYALSEREEQTLKAFLENPDKTQKELADMQGITLRTVQRHLSNIRIKTDTKSLAELSKLFYSA